MVRLREGDEEMTMKKHYEKPRLRKLGLLRTLTQFSF